MDHRSKKEKGEESTDYRFPGVTWLWGMFGT